MRAAMICAGRSGVSASTSSQPLSRSLASRGAVANSAPHSAPNAAMATITSTAAGRPLPLVEVPEKMPANSK